MGGHQGWRDDATDREGREDGRRIVGTGGAERLGSETEAGIGQETFQTSSHVCCSCTAHFCGWRTHVS